MADHITMSELKPGDLMFSYGATKDNRPGLGQGMATANHVSMVTVVTPNSGAQEVHQAGGKVQRIYQNDVRTEVEGPIPLGKTQSTRRVMRCTSQKLGERAAHYAKRWLKYQTPYSGTRVMAAEQHEKRFAGEPQKLILEHRMLFNKGGKYRAIKYAARRTGPLCYPMMDNGEQGMFCSMLVATCYQVAGLVAVVDALEPSDPSRRVSDKKMSFGDWKQFNQDIQGSDSPLTGGDMTEYLRYTENLRSLNPYGLGKFVVKDRSRAQKNRIKKKQGLQYVPSIALWTGKTSIEGCPWKNYITEGMMLDAKVIMPTGLYECLLSDGEGWNDMGYLVGPGAFTEAAEDRKLRQFVRKNEAAYHRGRWG